MEILEHDKYHPFKKEDNIEIPPRNGKASSLQFGSSGKIRFSINELPYKACFASNVKKDENKRSIIYLIAVQDVEK